jgi:hypothetical protein
LSGRRRLVLDLDFGKEPIARPLLADEDLLAFAKQRGIKTEMEDLLNRPGVTGDALLRLKADLSAAISSPRLDPTDVRGLIQKLRNAKSADQFQQELAELRHVNRVISAAGESVTSRVFINARQRSGPFKLSDKTTVDIAPVSEADALYLRGSTVHLDEVKNTAQALKQKIEKTPAQLDNMAEWRTRAPAAGPDREVGVHVETESRWTDVFSPLQDPKTKKARIGEFTLKSLIDNDIPLSIAGRRLSVAKMKELISAIEKKVKELGKQFPDTEFFDQMKTLKEAETFLGITL